MAKHIFTSQINWPGGRNAVGKLETGALQEKISIPSVMDGPGWGRIQTKCSWALQVLAIRLH